MTLPDPVRRGVEAALAERTGTPAVVVEVSPVGGGCVSPAARVRTAGAGSFFLKWSSGDLPAGMLAAEADGLGVLARSGTVRVPAVVALSPDPRVDWLVLEWLEPGSAGPGSWERLGRELAALHGRRGEAFGASRDNFIGALPQSNERADVWSRFWAERRLEPQLRLAVGRGHFAGSDRQRFARLLDRLPDLLGPGDAEGPSLLHGDLWGGNVHMLADGSPALIDPSAYHGHREVDLAMTELFGGFDASFMGAYREAWPLLDGYSPARRAVYQLYYLLVHVNLFGDGYEPGCLRALGEAGV